MGRPPRGGHVGVGVSRGLLCVRAPAMFLRDERREARKSGATGGAPLWDAPRGPRTIGAPCRERRRGASGQQHGRRRKRAAQGGRERARRGRREMRGKCARRRGAKRRICLRRGGGLPVTVAHRGRGSGACERKGERNRRGRARGHSLGTPMEGGRGRRRHRARPAPRYAGKGRRRDWRRGRAGILAGLGLVTGGRGAPGCWRRG